MSAAGAEAGAEAGAGAEVVLVTGAARGIGLAAAQRLAGDGWRVALADLDATGLERVAGELRADGADALAVPCDVADEGAVARLIGAVEAHFGRLDGLVNNAGIGGTGTPLVELKLDEWERMLRVDLTSVFLLCRAALPAMIRRGRGRIVNVSSVSAFLGVAGSAHYCAAKAGVVGLTRSLAREVAAHRINVNAVAPGVIDTAMARRRGIDHQRDLIPWPRIGTPDDVAAAVAYLLSPEAEFATGQVLHLNGGAYM